jgi:Methyltransferase domain
VQKTNHIELDKILSDPPRIHESGGHLVSWALSVEALKFIYDNIDDSSNTLETGCGLSTVVFALTGAQHTVVAPVGREFEILKNYCLERNIIVDHVDFVPNASQDFLPTMDPTPLDLVLIDGGHGFPTPYIDWFYTAGRLKENGYLIVDDVMLWSCQILHDFLMAQPQWELVDYYNGRTSIFRKLSDGAERLEWTQQPLVALGGRMKWVEGQIYFEEPPAVILPEHHPSTIRRVLTHLRRGDVTILAKKFSRRVKAIPTRRQAKKPR